MAGRASLIVILGFSLIIGAATRYWTYASGKAVQNVVNYYNSSRSHNNAVIAANIACDSIFVNNADTTMSLSGQINGHFQDGSWYKITTKMVQGFGKARNDSITAIGSDTDYVNNVIYNDTVVVILSPYSFSRFTWFTGNENGVNWFTRDTLTGPLQTNGNLYITGRPVINGPVTIGGSLVKNGGSSDSLICNSFRSGVTDGLPTTFDTSYTIGDTTKVFSNPKHTGSSYAYDVYLTFDTLGTNGRGRVTETDTTRYWNSGSSKWIDSGHTATKTIYLDSTANPKTGENLILVKDGDVHVSGIVHGNVTVLANQPTGTHRVSSTTTTNTYYNSSVDGNVLITGPITYKDKKAMTDGGTDMLGLVASNDVMLTTQPSGDFTIDAAIFALNGSFTYQNYTGNYLGYLYINGSIIQNSRGAVSQGGSSGATNGYNKNYRYDSRYRYQSPPGFPLSQHYHVIAWRE